MTPRARPFPRSRPQAGFTLVEALVAMTLMGLVLTGLALLTGQWLPGWSRGLARVQQTERLALAIDRMAADLAAAEFVPANTKSKKPFFAGGESAVIFVRTALGPNARPGLEIVQLAPASGLKGAALARSTVPFVPRTPEAPPRAFGPPVPLLDAPYRVSFSYAGRDGTWRPDWSDAEELPRAVRLVVRDGTSGRALAASTAAMVRAQVPQLCVSEKTEKGCSSAPPPGQTVEAPAQ